MLLINDLLNQIIARYASFVKGDFSATVSIDPSIDPAQHGANAVPTAKVTDLISFDDEGSAVGAKPDQPGSNSLMDDFASLTFDNSAPGASSSTAKPLQNSGDSNADSLFGLDMSKVSQHPGGQASQQQPIRLPTTQQSTATNGNGNGNGAMAGLAQPLQPSTATAAGAQSNSSAKPPAKSDPFADLDFLS